MAARDIGRCHYQAPRDAARRWLCRQRRGGVLIAIIWPRLPIFPKASTPHLSNEVAGRRSRPPPRRPGQPRHRRSQASALITPISRHSPEARRSKPRAAPRCRDGYRQHRHSKSFAATSMAILLPLRDFGRRVSIGHESRLQIGARCRKPPRHHARCARHATAAQCCRLMPGRRRRGEARRCCCRAADCAASAAGRERGGSLSRRDHQ